MSLIIKINNSYCKFKDTKNNNGNSFNPIENRNSSNKNSQEFYNNKCNQINERNTLDYLKKVTQNLQETKNIFMGSVLS
ncbi:hypothetical protein PIROE2DRAFT_1122 [Piromyces sp. E2]|nr:hypothetical protein PIROE2DRAFT_1122 [Piromyces sp. E2]|eukprot:OUM70600.1 hypothetical protein PIROE2DRAFT_1122 [Piromyces sp. E2]